MPHAKPPYDDDVGAKLDLLLSKLEGIEARLAAMEGGVTQELSAPIELALAGMTDEMVQGLVRKISALAELALDPFVLDALETIARALKASQAEYPDVYVPPVGGIFGALRGANDPDTRRVTAFALAVMRNLGRQFA